MAARRKRRTRVRRGGRSPRAHEADEGGTAGYASPACFLHEVEPAAAGACGVGIKRIYAAADPADGYRALIDRLWPRGISKERAHLDAWLTELAPSSALRVWFGHDPGRWNEFRRRYRIELRAQAVALRDLRQRAARQRVTLLYGSREPRINHALVLREVLLGAARARRGS